MSGDPHVVPLSAGAPARRMLFVGNSFTSRNDLPRMLAELAAKAEPPLAIATQMIVAGGASLRRHLNAGVVQRALDTGRFDDVVLQEQSTLPLKNPRRYRENVIELERAIAAAGARTVLYLTWARQSAAPQAQVDLDQRGAALAAETGATAVVVGRAWQAARASVPALALYADDGSHPTAAGSYLAACVFLAELFARRPATAGVSDRLGIDRDSAARIEAIAWERRSRAGA